MFVTPHVSENQSHSQLANLSDRFSFAPVQLPFRLRGERMDQRNQRAYTFGRERYFAALNAVHPQRMITVELDVGRRSDAHAELAPLSQVCIRFARPFLQRIRSKLDGPWLRLKRLLLNRACPYRIEGPYIPHSTGQAIMTLAITVTRDGNYDETYAHIRSQIECDPTNDDYQQFRNPSLTSVNDASGSYNWSAEELNIVEQMALLEPTHPYALRDFCEQERRAYNEKILKRVQQRTAVGPRDGAEASAQLLRNHFL